MTYDQTASDRASSNRRLLAMLFVDLVRSTDAAASMGDAGWVSLLGVFRTQAETTIVGYEGRLIKWIGDGFLATFEVPAGAVACGIRIVEMSRTMDLEVRAGVHTSEVVLEGDDIAGIAVHIAARIMALASPSEVLVSRTTVEVTAGTDFAYTTRGVHRLKGIAGDWDLFAATDAKEERLNGIQPSRSGRCLLRSSDLGGKRPGTGDFARAARPDDRDRSAARSWSSQRNREWGRRRSSGRLPLSMRHVSASTLARATT